MNLSSNDTDIDLNTRVELEVMFMDVGERPFTSKGNEFHDSIAL